MKIKDMASGLSDISFLAIISQVTTGKTNGANKSSYLNIVLEDRSGIIDAKLWSATNDQIRTLTQGTVIKGKGDIIKYNDNRQMKIISAEVMNVTDEEKLEYLPVPPFPKDEMVKELETYIHAIHSIKLYSITNGLYEDFRDAFAIYPAASRNHHEYVSGLIYHTLTMLKVAKSLCDIYDSLDRSLLYAGIILHDIGKIKELSGPIVPSYTLEGNLLGHISISNAMIKEKADELHIEGEEVILLQHLVLSHHGKNEYGSPVLPQIKEAEILSLIDNIDARMNMFNKALGQTEPGTFTKRIFALENRSIYKPKEDDE